MSIDATTTRYLGSVHTYLRDTFGFDLRSLSVFRIGLGVTLLVDLAIRLPDLERFYTDAGIIPRSAFDGFDPLIPSLHMLSGEFAVQAGLFALAAVFACLLIAGWRTRVVTIVSWFLLQSLHARNGTILNAGDILLRCMLFWGMFLPLGAGFGLDALRRKNRAHRPMFFGMASVGLYIQVMLMYVVTAIFKTGDAWLDGSALYYALSFDHLTPDWVATLLLNTAPLEHVMGRSTLDFLQSMGLPVIGATPWVTALLTYATLVFEYVGPLLLLCPWRRGATRAVLVCVFIGFHVATDICLAIGLFALICIVAWLAFIPGWLWERIGWRLPKTPQTGEQSVPRRCWPVEVGLALVIVLVTLWNARTADREHRVISRATAFERTAIEGLRLRQRWSMFSPAPGSEDGWWRVPARLVGGGEVDLATGAPPVWTPVDRQDGHTPILHPTDATLELARTKPADATELMPSHRHRKFLNNLRRSEQLPLRPRLAQYLCRSWNANHEGDQRLRDLRLVYMLERTPKPGEPAKPVQPIRVWHHTCQPNER